MPAWACGVSRAPFQVSPSLTARSPPWSQIRLDMKYQFCPGRYTGMKRPFDLLAVASFCRMPFHCCLACFTVTPAWAAWYSAFRSATSLSGAEPSISQTVRVLLPPLAVWEPPPLDLLLLQPAAASTATSAVAIRYRAFTDPPQASDGWEPDRSRDRPHPGRRLA